jgi:hypothetical protein
VTGKSINDCIPDDWKTVQFPHLRDIAAFVAVMDVAAKADLAKYYRQVKTKIDNIYLQGLRFGENPEKVRRKERRSDRPICEIWGSTSRERVFNTNESPNRRTRSGRPRLHNIKEGVE